MQGLTAVHHDIRVEALEHFRAGIEQRPRIAGPEVIVFRCPPFLQHGRDLAGLDVITAENLNGVATTDSENHWQGKELAEYLANNDKPASPLPVGAADGSHVEQSFLIPVANDKATEIGRRFQLIAVHMVFNKMRVEIFSCKCKGRHKLGNLQDVVVWPPIAAMPGENS